MNTGKVKVTLNVNPCDVADFTTSGGPSGPFNITFTEVPPSIGGSIATRGDTQLTLPGGGKVVTNGNSLNVGAVPTGTALNYGFDTSLGASLVEQTNVTVTITPVPVGAQR